MKNYSLCKSFVSVIIVAAAVGLALPSQAASVSYKVGKGTKIESDDGNNEVNMSGRIQVRHTYELMTNDLPDENSFAIERAKLKFKGHVLNPDLKYELQMAFGTKGGTKTTTLAGTKVVTGESTSGLSKLEDAFFDWTPSKNIGIKAGQFKVPFLKQELTSSGKQQFVDRSLSTGHFNFKRDIGIDIHGQPLEMLSYDLFAANGAGENNLNGNQGILFGTRLEVPVAGKYDSSESDTKYSEDVNAGFGLAYVFNEHDKSFSNGTVAAGTKTSHGTLDFGLKYKGFSTQLAAMILRTHEGTNFTNFGYNAQFGYFFIPEVFEVAVRAASTFFSNAIVNQHEFAGAFNWFIKDHSIKFQTDVAYLVNDGGITDQDDFRIRNQVQFIF